MGLVTDTGGVGYKPLYAGVSKVIREKFPAVQIRKMIMAPTGTSNKKQGLFEIIIDDHVRQSRSHGTYPHDVDKRTLREGVCVVKSGLL